MTYATLPRVPVRMVVSGSIVERCEPDEVLSIIEARLRSASPVQSAWRWAR